MASHICSRLIYTFICCPYAPDPLELKVNSPLYLLLNRNCTRRFLVLSNKVFNISLLIRAAPWTYKRWRLIRVQVSKACSFLPQDHSELTNLLLLRQFLRQSKFFHQESYTLVGRQAYFASMVPWNSSAVNSTAARSSNSTATVLLADGWIHQPNGRGTFDIIESCLLTIFLCSWSVLCLNLPGCKKSRWSFLRIKIKWMIFTIFFREVVVAFTAEQ